MRRNSATMAVWLLVIDNRIQVCTFERITDRTERFFIGGKDDRSTYRPVGDAVVARDARLAFHCTPVLEVCHTPGRSKYVVVKLCSKQISPHHTLVLHFCRSSRCGP